MSTKKLILATVSAQVAGAFITFISGPILGRLVGPVPYGIFAPVLSMNNLGQIFSESGLTAYTLTAKEISKEEVKDLHYQSTFLALSVGLAAGVGAAVIGHVPMDQRIFRGIATFCMIMLAGIAAVPGAMAQRSGSLGKMAWWTVLFSGTSTAMAIPMGIRKMGLAAVVSNNILIPLLNPVAYWRLAGLSGVRRKAIRISLRYRVSAIVAAFCYFLASGADSFVLATYLDNGPLGVYGRLGVIASLPGNVVITALHKVGVVHISQAASSKEQFAFVRKAMAISVGAYSLLILPSLLGLNVISFIFGNKFQVSNLAFDLITGASAFTFSSSLLWMFHQARRNYGPITTSLLAQASIPLGGFLLFHPTSLEAIGRLLLTGGIIGFIVVVGLTAWEDMLYKKKVEPQDG